MSLTTILAGNLTSQARTLGLLLPIVGGTLVATIATELPDQGQSGEAYYVLGNSVAGRDGSASYTLASYSTGGAVSGAFRPVGSPVVRRIDV